MNSPPRLAEVKLSLRALVQKCSLRVLAGHVLARQVLVFATKYKGFHVARPAASAASAAFAAFAAFAQVHVYPNPTSSLLYVSDAPAGTIGRILDLTGQEMAGWAPITGKGQTIRNLPSDVYVYQLKANHELMHQRIIVE